MKNWRKAFTVICAMALLFTFVAGSYAADFANTEYNLRVGTTTVGGVYNLVAAGWAQTIQKYHPNITWDTQVSGGSLANLQLYANGELDMPMALAVNMVDARDGGNRSFPEKVNFSSICVINEGFLHILVANNSGIKTIEDLKGKRVSVSEAGNSTESVATALFEVMGWDITKDIDRQFLGLQDAVDALSDGRIDVMLHISGAPTPAIQEATMTAEVGYVISIDPELIAKVNQKYPHFVLGTAPAGMFANEQPITSLACYNFLCTSPEMDEELVYNMTKAIFDHPEEWQGSHSSVANLVAANACIGSPVDFHPGAIRYFKEVGVWKE